MANPRLFLVDGSSLVYRAYYALLRGAAGAERRPGGLTTSAGLPTGAVYGFLNTLRKTLAEHLPEYVGIAFDERVPTFRHQAFAGYKAHRKPTPDDLVLQLPYIRRAVEALRIPVLVEERYEADDVIGTLALRGAAHGLDVVIVSSDKDMYQLLGTAIAMLQVRTETRMVTADDVSRDFGVRPEQVVDVLALWGDPSDNIPGVKGIGEKGAKALIAEWGDLDAVFAHLPAIRPALAAKLRSGEPDARLSRDLARIATDVELEVDLERLRRREPDRAELLALCRELEFRNLVDEFAPPPEPPPDVRVLEPGDELDRFLATARAATLAVDLVAAEAPGRTAPLGLGLATAAGIAYLPSGPGATLAPLLAALADPAIVKVATDLKSVQRLALAGGTTIAGERHDTSVLSYLLNPSRTSHDAQDLALEILGRTLPTRETLLGKGRGQPALEDVAPEAAARFAGPRAAAALDLVARLLPEVEAQGLAPLYRDVELPLAEVLAAMEAAGVRIDTVFLAELGAELEQRLRDLTRRIHELAGQEFNIQSPRQLGEVLFERMKLPVRKRTRKSRSASTDLEVLEELAASYELPRLVLEHRELAKLKGTYVDALPLIADPVTCRVHTSFHQTVAATGRLSSSDPNLQNIPIRTELGRRIRRAFVAPPGALLIVADYSQIELRLVAHLAQDPDLVAAFRDGADVHTRTAAAMFGAAPGLVTTELRRRAKVINFGILYGMSAYGLSRELRVSPGEAARLIEQYFQRHAGVRAWIERTLAGARASGRVSTLLGRIRPVPDITSPKRTEREYAERIAVNTPIQGTAADVIKVAMVRIHRRLAAESPRSRILLQVHDELVLETPADEAVPVTELVRAEMEGAADLSVPLVVSVGSGPNWLEAK